MESLKKHTNYKNFEIIIVENNSTTDEIFQYYKELAKDPQIHLLRWKKEFNYSAINNFGAAHAQGEYLLFLNNDIKVITPEWMDEMLGVCQRPEVGAVGVKLIYPDNTIQHAGCVVGMGGISSGKDAIEMMMAGASAVQVGAAIFTDPYAPLKIIDGMNRWLDDHGIASVREIVGTVQPW